MLMQRKNQFSLKILLCLIKLFSTIEKENKRQEQEIELIASENITSLAVMQAQGSVMTNKYAEGYSENDYYGGANLLTLQKILRLKN